MYSGDSKALIAQGIEAKVGVLIFRSFHVTLTCYLHNRFEGDVALPRTFIAR